MVQINIIEAGRPSVFLVRWLRQICGIKLTHQQIVPIVPKMFAASGIEDCGAISEKASDDMRIAIDGTKRWKTMNEAG